jgi:hypothetical protein
LAWLKRWALPSLALAALLLALLLLYFRIQDQLVQSEQQAGLVAGPTTPAETERDGLKVRGVADPGKLRPAETLSFWIFLENRSDGPLKGLRLQDFHLPPGFAEDGPCWQDHRPRCQAGDDSAARSPAPPWSLAKGQTVALEARVRVAARSRPGGRVITGVWTGQGEDGRQLQVPLAIGPIEVAPGPRPRWDDYEQAVYAFFKDLGLAVVLAVLPFVFQRIQQARARQEEARQFFLSRATDNAVRYLLPVSQLASQLRQTAGALPPGATARHVAQRQAFFYLISFVKKMRDLALEGGGILLTTPKAERLVDQCWGVLFERVRKQLGYVDLSHAVDLMEGHESITQFETAATPHHGFLGPQPTAAQEAVQRLREGFAAWPAADFARNAPYLDVFASVLGYEIDQLYAAWYDERDLRARKTELQASLAEVVIPGADPEAAEMRPRLQAYIEHLG